MSAPPSFHSAGPGDLKFWGRDNGPGVVTDLTCKRGSVGQSEGLLIPRSSVRFRLRLENSNSHGFELHRPSIKETKILLKVIKAIIIIASENLSESEHEQWSEKMDKLKDWVVWCMSREKDEEQHPFDDESNFLKLQQANKSQRKREDG